MKFKNIVVDSRKIEPGDLFAAYRGEAADGCDFIDAAIKNGAVAVWCDREIKHSKNVPIIYIPNLKEKIGDLAAEFYGYPSRDLKIIGVTGTSGKTSTTQFIASSLCALGKPCGIIGTTGIGFPGKLMPIDNTTPDAVTIQRWFHEFKKQGAVAVAMEVSSHSLVQPQRTGGIEFSIAVFTNLTRDHLDYHGTMENYGAAKKHLFTWPGLKAAVINADDEFGQKLLCEIGKSVKVYAYSAKDTPTFVPTVNAHNVELSFDGIKAKIVAPSGEGELTSSLLGRFNVSNILATLAVLEIMNIEIGRALEVVKKLNTVCGRMQKFGGGKLPLIVVDYAHKPDALEQALLALREHCHGVLWCVFGCGGDRDRGKRPMMGRIAERLSDQVIITDDNPRTEDPQQIVDDIVAGLLCPWAAEIEHDRYSAIVRTINCAKEGDVILIAGKGHEDYQIIGKEKIPFSDQEIVQKTIM